MDPAERLKLCLCFLVAGLHRGATQLKPFNPILGETYQGCYDDGTDVYCEQVIQILLFAVIDYNY